MISVLPSSSDHKTQVWASIVQCIHSEVVPQSTSPVSVPPNDLQRSHCVELILKDLIAYSSVKKPVAHAALKTFMRHLWYLSEILVALAFLTQKFLQLRRLVEASSKSGEDSPAPRADPIDEGIVSQLTLSHFASL